MDSVKTKVVEINDEEFSDIAAKDEFSLVAFGADWCPPCRVSQPILDKLSLKMDNVHFYHMNVDFNTKTPGHYNVMSIPTFILLKNKSLKAKKVGLLLENEFKKWLEEETK